MLPLLAITGPTAVGKTDFFLRLLKAGYNFEAIIVDSRQVYRHMDIGTGKDLPEAKNLRAKFWLYDCVSPDQSFSSAIFVNLATTTIKAIRNRQNQPVLLGGTGRYIKDLETKPSTLCIPPDYSLRQKLHATSVARLQQQLTQLNPEKIQRMNQSDINNPRRLIRAIEIAQNQKTFQPSTKIRQNIICLTAPLQLIKARIETRVNKRLKQGMIDEVKFLLDKYPNFVALQASHTPGYQEVIQLIEGHLSVVETKKRWINREYNYAKRQLTWFKHQTNAIWFDITKINWYAEAVAQLEQWGYVTSHT
jgi:tRNA dimethylallyltransferase